MVPPDSTGISRVPAYSGTPTNFSQHFAYGTVTLFGTPFQALSAMLFKLLCRSPTTPFMFDHKRFGLFPFRSPLLWESLLFSIPAGTEMFHFPALLLTVLYIQTAVYRYYSIWVGPFGNPRINS